MSRNIVGILGTAIVAIYVIGSGRLVTTDQQWYRSLSKPAWQPPSFLFGLIWPYNFALLIAATWIVASRHTQCERDQPDQLVSAREAAGNDPGCSDEQCKVVGPNETEQEAGWLPRRF